MGSQKLAHTSEDSPWSKKQLMGIWATQIAYTAIIIILVTAFQIRDGHGPDGLNFAGLLFIGISGFSYILFAIQIILYHRDRLSPMWMTVMSSLQFVSWLTMTIMSIVFLDWYWECSGGDCFSWPLSRQWPPFRVLMIFYIFVVLPSLYQLVYVCKVIIRFKDQRRTSRDAKGGSGMELNKV